MKIQLTKKGSVIAILSITLIILLFAGVYMLIVQPKKTELVRKETEYKTEEQLLAALQSQSSEANSNTFESTVELQQQVPVKPLLEQLVLNIEKAEVVSGSFVSSMNFGTSGVTVTDEAENETNEVEIDLNEEDKPEKSPIVLPVGVNKVSINLTVQSPSYFDLERFIEEIEQSERIIVVDNITFSGKEEITSLEQADQPLTFSLSVSAFYMPSLNDLIDQLPRMEVPKPSNKKNPFSSFSDVTDTP